MKKYMTLFCVLMIPLTLASDTQHRFKVHVLVGSDKSDKQAVNTIESHLKRELRLLGDVDITRADDDWEFIVYIFVMSMEFKDGRKTGHMTISTYEAYRLGVFHYDDPTSYKMMKATWGGTLGAAYYPREDLPKFCINYVNGFDKHKLEPLRSWNNR